MIEAEAAGVARVGARVDGRLLARNTLLNLIGQVLPLFVAVLAMPMAMRGLGGDSFGLLSLAWMVLGYFGIFDLGLGRAATRFAAEAIGRGRPEEVATIVWTSVATQMALGVVGGIALALITPWLVGTLLHIPEALVQQAHLTFYLLAISSPVVLVTATFRGVLEANQRFDLVNLVRIPASTMNYGWPALAVWLGLDLPMVVALLLLTKLAAMLGYAWCGRSAFRRGSLAAHLSVPLLRKLVTYGGWVTVSSVVGPILVYLDRILIGALVGVAAVGYYTAPYEMAYRMMILASSLVTSLFPMFSAASAGAVSDALRSLYHRALKFLLLLVGPVVVIAVVFGRELMSVWLGPEVGSRSAAVFQIIALGVLLLSLAQVPYSLVQGLGRPRWSATLHVIELVAYVPLAWLLVSQAGIVGGAVAWTLRVGIDALVLMVLARRLLWSGSSPALSVKPLVAGAFGLALLAAGLTVLKSAVGNSYWAWLGSTMAAVLIFAMVAWGVVLDHGDRALLGRALVRANPLGR